MIRLRSEQAEEKLRLGPGYMDEGYVFSHWDGQPHHPERFSREFDRNREYFNRDHPEDALPPITLHGLRHTAQLIYAAVANQTEFLSRGHVAADRLAVHLRQPLNRTQPFTIQPQPDHFSDLEHTNLPERHGLPFLNPLIGTTTSAPSTEPALDTGGPPGRWSHHWRSGGPMPLAQLNTKWFHAAGGRHGGVVDDVGCGVVNLVLGGCCSGS